MISIVDADWTREAPRRFWDPGRKLLCAIRKYQLYKQKKGVIAFSLSKVSVVQHLFWSTVSGADIPINCKLGGGLLTPHPNGIVIHPDAEIGVNCLIHQQCTIGVKRGSSAPPRIGGHVDIGAGAKIIGNICIGNDVLVGANAVVVNNVEAEMVVAGIPAKVIGNTRQGC